MKFFFFLFFIASLSYAKDPCDLNVLGEEIIDQYKRPLPVTNSKGELGHGRGFSFKIPDYVVRLRNTNLLIANFEMQIKWLSGKEQRIKSIIIAQVNLKKCSIEKLEAPALANYQP